jgi:membrane-bound ClpP family serine protease
MRTLFVFLLIAGVTLLTIAAVVPEQFVLALIGMVVLTGTASLALATMAPPRPPQPHH